MEDKELQQLFEAKRTAEDNRRRQEELAAMIGHKAKNTRPLWPIWAVAAAAAVFAAILLMRPLFSSNEEMPLLAQADPATVIDAEPDTTIALQPQTPTPARSWRNQTKDATQEVAVVQFIAESTETLEKKLPEEEPIVEETLKAPEQETAAPVRRRLTNNLACVKGCSRPKGGTQEGLLQWNTQQEAQGITFFAMN